MADLVVLDTGPFVALLDRHDPMHRWATKQSKQLRPPFVTCEAVVAEAIFLLQDVHDGLPQVSGLLRDGFVRLGFHLDEQLESITTLMAKYHDVPMSLADACLVRMSELHDRARVFTLDADFKLYRRHGRQAIPLTIP